LARKAILRSPNIVPVLVDVLRSVECQSVIGGAHHHEEKERGCEPGDSFV